MVMIKRVCPKWFFLLVSLISPSCNFLLGPRQGRRSTDRRSVTGRTLFQSSSGSTGPADERRPTGLDSGIPECVGDCVFPGTGADSRSTLSRWEAARESPEYHDQYSALASPTDLSGGYLRASWVGDLQDKLLKNLVGLSTGNTVPRTLTPHLTESITGDVSGKSDRTYSPHSSSASTAQGLARPLQSSQILSTLHYFSELKRPVRINSNDLQLLEKDLSTRNAVLQNPEKKDHDLSVTNHRLLNQIKSAEKPVGGESMPSLKQSLEKTIQLNRKVYFALCHAEVGRILDLDTESALHRLCTELSAHGGASRAQGWHNDTDTDRNGFFSQDQTATPELPDWKADTEKSEMAGEEFFRASADSDLLSESVDNMGTAVEDWVELSAEDEEEEQVDSDTQDYDSQPGDGAEDSEGEDERKNNLNMFPGAARLQFDTEQRTDDIHPATLADTSYDLNTGLDPLLLAPNLNGDYVENSGAFSKRRGESKDKKVFVYGQDDRLRVFLSQMRKFPFSNIARLSTGCTGTLVTPRHVLTAAHCVHNGLDFRSNLEMLKVEIPDTMGFRTYYAQKISVPTRWLRETTSNSINNQSGRHAAYDYAVVRLKLAVAGRDRFLPLAVPRADVLTLDINFLAFPESDHGMWRSVCPASAHMARMDGNLILTRCDAAVGNSGAAVFTNEPYEGMRIIGILSNTMHVAYHRSFDRYSIITALTWPKLTDICHQLGTLGQQYSVCPPFRYMRRASQPVRLKAIPFFGKRQAVK